jgi:hypothetical protein
MTRVIPAIASALILSVSLPAISSAQQITRSLSLEDRSRYDDPAAKGDPRAQTALGLRFAGHKTPESDAAAFKWFKRAADQGDAEAQILLSGLYATGRGTPKDYVAAYKWAYLSGLRATEPEIIVNASNMIGVLNRQMTDDELDRARQQAVAWTAKPERVQTATTEPATFQTASRTQASVAAPQPAPAPVKTVQAEPAKVEPVKVEAAKAEPVKAKVAKVEPAPVAVSPAAAAAQAKAEPQVQAEPQTATPPKATPAERRSVKRTTVKRSVAKSKPRTRNVRNVRYDEMIGTAMSYARAYGIHLGGWQY